MRSLLSNGYPAVFTQRLDKLPDILKEDGSPDVQAFMATY